ncbi:hypothetical protein ACO1O0_001677 [Amphichorda felina]
MSSPRVKRPFAGAASDPSQRQITSFFNTRPTADPLPEAVCSPALPANVQSNLLSVGMRVRKSVPEGYKVVGPSAFKLWTDNTPLPTASRPALPPTAQRAAAPRELLPFCGINSIGGLSSQPEVHTDAEEDDDVPGLDDIPELTLSQESTDSTDSNANARKRFFTDDTEDTVDPVSTWVATEGDVSPRTLTPSGFGNARVMAIPRSRAAKRMGMSPMKEPIDQENMEVDGDFEEAEFLVYGEGREMDTTA